MKSLDPEAGYDLVAKDYRKEYPHLDSFDWDLAQKLINGIISHDLVNMPKPWQILDAGCGDGRALVRLMRQISKSGQSAQFWGWDISAGMLRQAEKRLEGPAKLIHHNVVDTPPSNAYPPGGFHLVSAFFLIVHLDHVADFLKPLQACMAKDGRLILNSIPQRQGYTFGKGKDAIEIHYQHHEPDAIQESLIDCGWELVQRIDGPWSSLFDLRVV